MSGGAATIWEQWLIESSVWLSKLVAFFFCGAKKHSQLYSRKFFQVKFCGKQSKFLSTLYSMLQIMQKREASQCVSIRSCIPETCQMPTWQTSLKLYGLDTLIGGMDSSRLDWGRQWALWNFELSSQNSFTDTVVEWQECTWTSHLDNLYVCIFSWAKFSRTLLNHKKL